MPGRRSSERNPPSRGKGPRRSVRRTPLSRKRLNVALAPAVPATVPKRWVKLVVGFFLLVPAGILTQTFFEAFTRTTVEENFWISEPFWYFSLGITLWLVIFFSVPRPLMIYVFGHELTHALWVWVLGGRVHRFEVGPDGGYILADRTNTWIALAPYFFPIYSIAAIVLYGVAGLIFDVAPYAFILYGALGLTWGFHFTFTCWMIWKGQPDLYYGGTFFSLVVIYTLNLLILCTMLIIFAPGVGWGGFLHDLIANAVDWTVAFTLYVNGLVR